MQRMFFAAVAATLLMVGCAQTDAPSGAVPASSAPSAAPQAAHPSAVKSPAVKAPTNKSSAAKAADNAGPSPLLNPPGSSSQVISGGSREACLQQCERSYQICMDGTAARADTATGTLYEGRLFGPAARCETSLSSCLSRCNAATAK